MTEFNYRIKEEDKELTVKELLRRNYHFSSRLLTRLKQQDLVTLNGQPVRGWMKPEAGDLLTVNLPAETSDYLPENIPLAVVFEDEALLVLNKQPGYVVHPTKGKPCHTIANGLMYKMLAEGSSYKIRFANRLDMNTSGLLIVAKSGFVQEALIRQMKRGQVQKRYLAVVDGLVASDSGTIDAPIGRPDPDEVERWLLPVEQGGYDSVTHYHVLRRFPAAGSGAPCGAAATALHASGSAAAGHTLVELTLETGRTHQIRVHMASIGHPVTGDHLYNNGDPFLYRRLHGDFRRPEGEDEKSTSPYIDRQALHAYRLSFTHPLSGELLALEAPLPADMQELISKLAVDRDSL